MWNAAWDCLQPQPWHHNITRAQPYPNYTKNHTHLNRHNRVRVHPYAHPLHMKVLKHFIYIWYGCGMQSMGVLSLNHTLQQQHHSGSAIPLFSKNSPPPAQVYQCKGAPICLCTAYQCIKTLCMHMIWIWNAARDCLQPQPWHYNITRAQPYPYYAKNHTHLHRHNRVRVHPYAHPQHMKVLKHFIYIWYGCEMQSTGVWSLNHDITTSLGLSHTPIVKKTHPPAQA